ncbi:MAG: T9SS type A sorting domain-containing protein [Saprospiraceae bacterium]
MKKLKLRLIAVLLLFISFNIVQAQDITYIFANVQNTNDGVHDYYEVDILLSSTTDFKLGIGQIYLNYNTAAFGANVFANSNITFSYDYASGYLIGEDAVGPFGTVEYYSKIPNDNTSNRVSFSWVQEVSEGGLTNSITSTPTALFHVKIKYTDVTQDPDVCFESGSTFEDLTYTACGPSSGGLADCNSHPGSQIFTDNFDCVGAVLPVEVLYFTGKAQDEDVLLEWETASEINNSHFEVERSTNGLEFSTIGIVEGSGTTVEQQYYDFLDKNPVIGKNYYRLRQVDFNGDFEYTNVIVIEFDKEGVVTTSVQVSAFPNPTIDVLNIKTKNLDIQGYQIFNSLGQLMMEQQSLGSDNLHQINVKNLASGTYFIQLSGSDEHITFTKG